MGGEIIFWDEDLLPPNDHKVISWKNQENSGQILSVLSYLEMERASILQEYLSLTNTLANLKYKERYLVDYLKPRIGISIWWMGLFSENSHLKMPVLNNILKLFALRNILIKEKPSALKIYTQDEILFSSVVLLCNELGIRITFPEKALRKLSSKYLTHKPIANDILNLVTVPLYFAFIHIKTYFQSFFLGSTHAIMKNSVFIMSYFDNIDFAKLKVNEFYSSYWHDLPILINDAGMSINWVHRFIKTEKIKSIFNGFRILKTLNSPPNLFSTHNFLNGYLSKDIYYNTIIDWFRIFRLTRKIELDLFKRKNYWGFVFPYIKKYWDKSTKGTIAFNNIYLQYQLNMLFRQMPQQKFGLFLYEGQGWERAFWYFWNKSQQGKLYSIQHSTVSPYDLRYLSGEIHLGDGIIFPGNIATNSRFHKQYFLQCGIRSNAIHEVEGLRYLQSQTSNNTIDKSSKMMKKILILGDISSSSTKNLITVLENSSVDWSQFSIIIKYHPNDTICYKPKSMVFNVVEDNLREIYNSGEIGLTIATCKTSSALDSLIAGIPAMVFANEGKINYSPLIGVPQAVVFNQQSDINCMVQNHFGQDMSKLKYFYDDVNLPRWRKLIESNNE